MPTFAAVKNCVLTFFRQLGKGRPFSIRLLFGFGKEWQLYKAGSELVDAKKLVRVALGVYMLPTDPESWPSDVEIARAKAAGFGKEIFFVNDDFLPEIQHLKIVRGSKVRVFATRGASSSFLCGTTKIVFYKVADRKAELLREKIGKVYNTLWKSFPTDKKSIDRSFDHSKISSRDLNETPKLLHLLPMWLKTSLREFYPLIPWQQKVTAPVFSFFAARAPSG